MDKEVVCVFECSLNSHLKTSLQPTTSARQGVKALGRDINDALRRSIDWLEWQDSDTEQRSANARADHLDILLALLRRFDRIVRQLRRRRGGRPTLEIDDEYDVQDLLHAVLRGYFPDVRPEDPAPSRAGASSRVDFLLKQEEIVVETKYATKRLGAKQIGEQLIVDIDRYAAHPACKILACLVYDPDFNLENPTALENDLSGKREKLEVYVLVAPK